MTIDGSHLGSTRSRHGLQRRLWILSVETLLVHHEILCWDLRSSRSVPAFEWVLGIRSLFLTSLLCHLLMGIWIHHLFCLIDTSSALILRGSHLMHPTFPSLLSKNISKFSPAISSKNTFVAKLMNPCLISWWRRTIFNHCSKKYYWPFEWLSESSFVWCFPIFQEVMDISQISKAFQRVLPLGGKILYHDSVPVICLWMDSHPSLRTVFRRYQFTNFFCSR